MSGGIAYVLDVNGQFSKYCNTSMVELLPVVQLEDAMLIHSLLEEFADKTGSDYAKELLKDWPKSRYMFVKVFPYEYQRALLAQEEEEKKKGAITKSPNANIKTNGYHKKSNDITDIEDVAGPSQTVDKTRGFMKYKRESHPYRPAEKRLNDWDEIYNFTHVKKGLKVQAARCMDCGVPFCQSSYGCPLGNIIPKWNDLVSQDKWKEALDQLLQTNNFPEFTGRVCPAPCESACVLGINSSPVAIKSIECAIIDYAFDQGWMLPNPPFERTGKKVAVVGSGPAGLACAHQLNKVLNSKMNCSCLNFYNQIEFFNQAGHLVTVYERDDAIGGLLQYGIPTMKLSRAIIDRRVELMRKEGIAFLTGVNIGEDVSAEVRKSIMNKSILVS